MHECAPWVECMQEAANSRTVATHVKKKKITAIYLLLETFTGNLKQTGRGES